MTNISILKREADIIDRTTADLGASVFVTSCGEHPGWRQYNCKLGPGVKYSRVAQMRADLQLALGVPVVRFGQVGNRIAVQVPSGSPIVHLDELLRNPIIQQQPPVVVPLGIGDMGDLTVLRFGDTASNILLSGLPGSGKTTLAWVVLMGLAWRNTPGQCRIVVIDPKPHDLAPLYRALSKNLSQGLAQTSRQIDDALSGILSELNASRAYERETVIFIDELSTVIGLHPENLDRIMAILRKGREHGYRILACEQYPGHAPVAGELLGLFHVRISGRQSDAAASYNATGVPNAGAETLLGEGDFVVARGGQLMRFKAAMTPTFRRMPGEFVPAPPSPAELTTPAIADAAPGESAPTEVDAPPAKDSGTSSRWTDEELAEDAAVYLRMSIDGTPGVTAWASERFSGKWTTPYAGNRIPWMKERYNLVSNLRLASR